MIDNNHNKVFDESSPSVQTHLGILQNTIQRMASNSASSKNWCATLVSAVLVIVANKGKPDFAFISLIPTVLFMALDAYYLALEKSFRDSYNSFVGKLHNGLIQSSDLYSISPRGNMSRHQFNALKSFSVWSFYLMLILLIFLARYLVIV